MLKYVVNQIYQVGSNVPEFVEVVNELPGTPVWTRVAAGVYRITLAGAFPVAKTVFFTDGLLNGTGVKAFATISLDDASNAVTLVTRNASNAGADGILYSGCLMIQVYP